jgi:hypothetical protein
MSTSADIDWQLLSVKRPAGKPLLLFFFLLPVLDNLSGAGAIFYGQSISFFLRLLVMVFFFSVASTHRYASPAKLLAVIAVLALPIAARYIAGHNVDHLFGDLVRLLKTLYGIFGIYCVYALLSQNHVTPEQLATAVVVSVVLYSAVIIAAFALDVGIAATGEGGVTGFVIAGNDVSHSIAISVPFVFWFAANRTSNSLFRVGLPVVVATALFLLFTKSGILGLMVLLLLIFLGSTRYVRVALSLLVVGIIGYVAISIIAEQGIVYEFVSIYLRLHEEYGFLGLFFRGRQQIFPLFPKLFGEMSFYELSFGTGFTAFMERYADLSTYWSSRLKNAEMDLFDLFFSHGFIATGVVLWIYIRHSKYAFFKTKAGIDLRFSLLIFWIHSIFAGHAISTPIVGTYIAAILGLGYFERHSQKVGLAGEGQSASGLDVKT